MRACVCFQLLSDPTDVFVTKNVLCLSLGVTDLKLNNVSGTLHFKK